MAATLTTMAEALKNIYLPALAKQLNTEVSPFFNVIEKGSENIIGGDGKIVQFLGYGVSGGVGAGTETGALPTAGEMFYKQAAWGSKNLFATIEISHKAMKGGNNGSAIANLLTQEMEGALSASKFNLDRQLMGDGTGKLGLTGVTTASATLVLNAATTRKVVEGMIIDIYNVSNAKITNGSARRIIAVDRANNTVTLDAAGGVVTTAVDGYITVQGSKDNEITGFGAIFAQTGSIYGLAKADYPFLKPYVKTSAGTISDALLQTGIDYAEEFHGAKIDMILVSRGVRRAYLDYFETTKRQVNTLNLEGGFSAISYNGVAMVPNRFLAAGEAMFLDTSSFKFHEYGDWDWMADENGAIIKQNAGYPTFKATMYKYGDLGCKVPAKNVKFEGITEA